MGFTLYGVLAALAMAALLAVTGLAGRKRSVGYGSVVRFAVLAVPLAFLCSRLVYGVSSLDYYLNTGHLGLLLQVRDGGYSMLGAILGVLLAACVTERWQKLPAGTLLDAAALGMPAALLIARLAEPLCGMGWGYPYYSPLFYFLDGLTENLGDFAYTHPVFAYEAIAAAALSIALPVIARKARRGDTLLSFLLVYGCTQTVMESMLNGGHMKVIHFVKINQVAAMVMALIPLIVWSRRLAKAQSGSGLRIAAAWVLAVVCILSGVVQEFSVEGQDNPYFSVVIVGAVIAGLLAAAAAFWCVAWRGDGLKRILPVAIVSLIAISAAIIDRVTDVGDHYRLVLWGIMAADMVLLGLAGFALRKAADTALARAHVAEKYGLQPPINK